MLWQIKDIVFIIVYSNYISRKYNISKSEIKLIFFLQLKIIIIKSLFNHIINKRRIGEKVLIIRNRIYKEIKK